MKRLWSTDELTSQRALSADDMRLAVDHGEQAKLGLMCQLAFWREHARFPELEADLAPAVIEHLAAQIGLPVEAIEGYDFAGRSGRRHRRVVLDHLAVNGAPIKCHFRSLSVPAYCSVRWAFWVIWHGRRARKPH